MTGIRIFAATSALALCVGTLGAQAQGLSFSGGATVTSNYMSRGATLSDNRPALQAFAEAEVSGLYFGAFASTVRLAPDSSEFSLYGGYRFSVEAASFDLGYARYLYNSSGDCCGELYALFEVDLAPATLFGGVYLDSARLRRVNDLHLGVSYGFGDGFSTSLTAGRAAGGIRYGILGLGYQINDLIGVEAAYHTTNAQRDQVVVSATASF